MIPQEKKRMLFTGSSTYKVEEIEVFKIERGNKVIINERIDIRLNQDPNYLKNKFDYYDDLK